MEVSGLRSAGLDRPRREWSTVQVAWRIFGYLVFAIVVAAVAYPLTWPRGRDSFPLSSYPMFSRKLPTAEFSLQYAVGVTTDGKRHHLAPEFVANDEVLQARAVLRRAVRGGKRAVTRLCQRIARRVSVDADLRAVEHVRIVTGRHDAVAYLTGRDRVGKERVHGQCRVKRNVKRARPERLPSGPSGGRQR